MAREQIRIGEHSETSTPDEPGPGVGELGSGEPGVEKPAVTTDVPSKGSGFPGFGKAVELIGTGVTREQMNSEIRFRPQWDEHTTRDWPNPGSEQKDGKDSKDTAKPDSSDVGERAEQQDDPEGSWRDKDSDRYLAPEQNVAIDTRYQSMKELADNYGEHIKGSAAEAQGETAGYEFRLKGPDRLKDKVAERLVVHPDASPDEILSNIPDAIRYTIKVPDASYAEGVDRAVNDLRSKGLQIVEGGWKNSWENDIYRGINSRWRDPENGQLLEIQFHTPGSFYAKQVTHEAYERARQPGLCGEELQEIDRIQGGVTEAVRVPDRAPELSYEPDWRYDR